VQYVVGGKPYCDVRVDRTRGVLEYPDVNPTMTTGKVFIGWSTPEGGALDGIENPV